MPASFFDRWLFPSYIAVSHKENVRHVPLLMTLPWYYDQGKASYQIEREIVRPKIHLERSVGPRVLCTSFFSQWKKVIWISETSVLELVHALRIYGEREGDGEKRERRKISLQHPSWVALK